MHGLVDLLAQVAQQGRASLDMSMRRRTSAPSRNSAMPSRYLPVSPFCSSMPSATSVTASRCTVLLATPSRRARSLMPMSTCSSENAFSSRTEVATGTLISTA